MTLVLFVHGEGSELYALKDVPHGDLSTVWYPHLSLVLKGGMSIYTPLVMKIQNRSILCFIYCIVRRDEEAWAVMGRACQILDNL